MYLTQDDNGKDNTREAYHNSFSMTWMNRCPMISVRKYNLVYACIIYAESIQQKICIKKFTNFANFVTSILKQNMSCFFFFVCVGGGEIMTPKRLSVNDVQGSGNTIKCTCISTSLTISFLTEHKETVLLMHILMYQLNKIYK